MEFLSYFFLILTCECALVSQPDVIFYSMNLFFFFKVFSSSRADDSEALREAAIVQPTAIVNPYVTQNVYGFADFTTTIGNTVMIFSPSSIAVPGMKKYF